MTFFYRGNSKQAQEFKPCAQCEIPSFIYKGSKFCSRTCMGEARKGKLNPNWRPKKFKGTPTEYKLFHARVAKARGRAAKCINGCVGYYHWANLTGNYSDPDDYIELCVRCHSKFDKGVPLSDIMGL